MVLRWMDPEVAGRYGTGVYVRCAPEGTAARRRTAADEAGGAVRLALIS